MTSLQSIRQEDANFRVLHMLQDNPDGVQREIAEKMCVSTSGLGYYLIALINKRWVKAHNFSQSKKKIGYIYVVTPENIAENALRTGPFLKRKMHEYEALRQEIAVLKAESIGIQSDAGQGFC